MTLHNFKSKITEMNREVVKSYDGADEMLRELDKRIFGVQGAQQQVR